MSEQWAERIRHTNQLVRVCAGHVFSKRRVSPDQLYGLCKLTWITDSYSGEAAAYIQSTKIPALCDVFDRDFRDRSLDEIATEIGEIMESRKVRDLVLQHSGFTNLYKSYRNTARQWIQHNHRSLLPMFRAAYALSSDLQGLKIVQKIQKLPRVPKAKNAMITMHAEYLLTPVFACLDKRRRFPLINGNDRVRRLLKTLQVQGSDLSDQYQSMISLYGNGGILDSADLDQIDGADLSDFLPGKSPAPTKQLLRLKPTSGNKLRLKDEGDVLILQDARQLVQKRLHNSMTNRLRKLLSGYTLLEGEEKSAMFDVLVKKYNKHQDDLLIEVKSSAEDAHVRMAIGQLYSYWYQLKMDREPHLAVLLPDEPSPHLSALLEWLGIGVLWFDNDTLATSSTWLRGLADAD